MTGRPPILKKKEKSKIAYTKIFQINEKFVFERWVDRVVCGRFISNTRSEAEEKLERILLSNKVTENFEYEFEDENGTLFFFSLPALDKETGKYYFYKRYKAGGTVKVYKGYHNEKQAKNTQKNFCKIFETREFKTEIKKVKIKHKEKQLALFQNQPPKIEVNITNEIEFCVEKILTGTSRSEILSELKLYRDVSKASIRNKIYSKAVEYFQNRVTDEIDLSLIISQHVQLYETIYTLCYGMEFGKGTLKALRQKEKLLGIRSNIVGDYYIQKGEEKNQKTIEYDLNLLTEEKKNRLEQLLSKVKNTSNNNIPATSITDSLYVSIQRKIFSESYYEFFKWGFSILFPNERYEDNFHIKYICDLLQEEIERIIKRKRKKKDIIINIPPRTSKSLMCSVLLNCWAWIKDPTIPFICVSFDEQLMIMNARYCKDIIHSPQYRKLFGDIFYVRRDVSGVELFMNNKGGFRLSKTTGSNITGHKGCHRKGQFVTLRGGDKVKIEDLINNYWINLEVLSQNRETGELEYKEIENVMERYYTGKMYTINLEDKKVTVTGNHKFNTQNRGIVAAEDLTITDYLFCEKRYINITHITSEYVVNELVYNLSVSDNHNYFVNDINNENCVIVVDDIQNPKTSESKSKRDDANGYYTQSLYNRLTPINLGIRIIVMQRLHVADLTGYLLDLHPEKYTHICLPAELTKDIKPVELRDYYIDGLLDPNRLDRISLQDFKTILGTRGYVGQYGQTPSVEEGNIIKEEWFDIISPSVITRDSKISPIKFTLDSAYTDNTENDPSGILTYFIKENCLYILDFQEKWLGFPQLLSFIQAHVKNYQYTDQSNIIVEPKASGKSIVQQLHVSSMLNIFEGIAPDTDKKTRTYANTPLMESRRVKIVDGSYVKDFMSRLKNFPNDEHDEAVDCLNMAIDHDLKNNNPPYMFL